MTTPKADRPSEEVMWAGPSGERWLQSAARFEMALRPIGDALLDRAALRAGEHVLDVGCGAGGMSLEIAKRVAPTGSVTGLDISPALIAEATRRGEAFMAATPTATVRFVVADAARTTLGKGRADVLVSRFGTMFFTDPFAAFGHMHTLLRPAGRLALACWAPLGENPWMLEVRTILGRNFELPAVPPRTPGPFAFDEPEYLRDILSKAGFKGIAIDHWATEMFVGGPGSDPASAADFLFKALSMAQRAIDAPQEVRNKVRVELITSLERFMTPGGVRMPAAAWFTMAEA